MKTLKNVLLLLLLTAWGCSVKPNPIDYGNDSCHFCKMTIVDKVHGAELVTNKGKTYKFDASECMINFMNQFEDSLEIKLYLTNHYKEPEILIDATNATFLISEKVPSPMGAFLTAFKNKVDAEKTQSEKGGILFSWEELLVQRKKL
ncbi:nitrous oxide reductase accessory protein NosL [Tamlana flava]|uniref:nitrous oxide reductase accessory protein NosL n=1 Tax=Tamlana flava TaxID=3158572 RepID=UPI00351BB060